MKFEFENPTLLDESVVSLTGTGLTGNINPVANMTLEQILNIDYDNSSEPGESANVDTKDSKDSKDSNVSSVSNVSNEPENILEANSGKTETQELINKDYEGLSNIAPVVAQLLADNGFFTELPSDVDEENFDEDALIKTFKHNLGIAEQKSFDEGINYERDRLTSTLPETGLRLLEFLDNPNLDDDEIKNYLRSVIFENDITRLDPDDSYDAEKIVRTFYSQDNRFSQDEIDSKISDLIQLDKLKKEASVLKPKVDAQASKMAQEQIEMKRAIQEQEKQLQGFLVNRTKEMLNKGTLNGMPLSREDAELAYKLIVNNDIPIPVKGGKKVEMGFAELEIFKHKYTKEGSLDNLALGLLVMAKGPEIIERYFQKKAKTEATKEFINQNKFNFQKKSGTNATTNNISPKNGKGDISFPLLNR